MDKTKELKRWGLVAVCVTCSSACQTLGLKASIGVCACWDSLSMNIYELTGIKVGTMAIIFNCFCVLLQFLLLRSKFPKIKILQIFMALLSGSVVNVMYYYVFTFDVDSYAVRFILMVLSFIGISVFTGCTTALDLITMPLEAVCYTVQQKYGVSFTKMRIGTDVFCTAYSLILSLIFGLSLKIREGTIVGMIIVGPLMGKCIKIEKKIPFIRKLLKDED